MYPDFGYERAHTQSVCIRPFSRGFTLFTPLRAGSVTNSCLRIVSFPDPTTHARGKGRGTLAPILGSASSAIM